MIAFCFNSFIALSICNYLFAYLFICLYYFSVVALLSIIVSTHSSHSINICWVNECITLKIVEKVPFLFFFCHAPNVGSIKIKVLTEWNAWKLLWLYFNHDDIPAYFITSLVWGIQLKGIARCKRYSNCWKGEILEPSAFGPTQASNQLWVFRKFLDI